MTTATEEPKKLLTESEAAQRLGVQAGTLTVWRSTRRYDLAFCKIGRCIRYDARDIESFIARRRVGSTTVETS
ncbi:MAG: helix-turn-helix domain-containing protein [Planctomycetota bacterium]